MIAIEFPELMDKIDKAFERVGGHKYIQYAESYRYQGRINLLNRVKKQIEVK